MQRRRLPWRSPPYQRNPRAPPPCPSPTPRPTVLGTPVLGLSTLLVSKLLSNPLGKAVAYEYSVTGSWDNPVVTKISAPAAIPAKAATADAQK